MSHFLCFGITAILLLLASAGQGSAEIGIEALSKERATELGITMKFHNGKDSVKVWLEFKKEGPLKNFDYVDLNIDDATEKRVLSAMLKPHPVVHGQSNDIVSVAFSADPAQLAHSSFLVVVHDRVLGGQGYQLNVPKFIDVEKQQAEDK